MRRVTEIFLRFGAATGHQHPHLMVAVNNHATLLAAMGHTQEEILARLDEIGRPFGISFGAQ